MRPIPRNLIALAHAGLFITTSLAAATTAPREHVSFNQNWSFIQGDPAEVGDSLDYAQIKPWLLPTAESFVSHPSARPEGTPPGESVTYAQPEFDHSDWRTLDLPHDWGIEGPFDQALPGETAKLPWFGKAWYRKSFDLAPGDADRRIYLAIDGAMSYSSVWCNGQFVGGWPYGYTSYHLDLTPYLKHGASNTLAIRLDNPKESSRWYPGGGLYRKISLIKTAPVHILPWGTYLTTPTIKQDAATVDLEVALSNQSDNDADIALATQIFKRSKEGLLSPRPVVSGKVISQHLNAGTTTRVQSTLELPDPILWDIENAQLYTAVTFVQQNGEIIDRYETTFGVRHIEFNADQGFRLNGKSVPLKGVCMHHDLGALGAAFNLRAAERQLEIMKEMGFNALRTAHNPPAPEVLDICDRMGIVVIDESFDCWRIAKKPFGYNVLFDDWAEADLRAMIRRDRNHPSVIMWSIGNEIIEQGMDEGFVLANKLVAIINDEDDTRFSTIGSNNTDAGLNGFQKEFDVYGYNYRGKHYGQFHETSPNIPILGSETASTISSRGEYVFPVSDDKNEGKQDFQMSSYDLYAPYWAQSADAEFMWLEKFPFAAGEFVWTGFDYLGEPTPYNDDFTNLLNFHDPVERAKAEKEMKALGKVRVPSRSSYFGIVDLAGFKKDRFFLYQAHWRPDLPMAHILPHWNWPERVGEITPVHVYTSGDSAELFLNGQSLGRKSKARFEYRLRWDEVTYEPGELKVVAYKDGRHWATETVKTSGAPSQLRIEADRQTIATDGVDLSFITVSVTDRDGLPVPRVDPMLHFSISGPGVIVATDNGDPTDHTPFQSPSRAAFNGLALAIVRTLPGASEPISVRVLSDGLQSAELTLNPSQAMPDPANPTPKTWSNPILPQRADPHVFLHSDGYYYLAATVPEYDLIELRRARSLQGLSSAEAKVIWTKHASGPMGAHIWAPEIHFLDGKWYIYFAAGESKKIWNIRSYVLENSSPNPLEGQWVEKGQIKTQWDTFNLDATVFEHRGTRYLSWAQGAPDSKGTQIYISKMDTPWSLTGEQVMLTKPDRHWERINEKVNEGPAFLHRNGRIFLTYSASATDANYCLGMLTADEDADLLDPNSWKKSPVPVLKSNNATSQYGPGHNSFTTSPDGLTDIIVYHARSYKKIKGHPLYNHDRATRAQVIKWKPDGSPDFGIPVADGPLK